MCVWCASVLLGTGFTPPPGITAEIGGSYSTIQRKYETPPDAPDYSNVTAKFVLIGVRGVWPAAGDLGAGTPAREWRVRLALAPAHNDQVQLPSGALGLTTAYGTGRFENFAVLYRQPLGAADSLEVGWTRHKNDSTDGINLGGSHYTLSEQRLLYSSRDDWGLGWRHRFRGLEVAVAGRLTQINSSDATSLFSGAYSGNLWGGDAEVRWRQGRWTVQAEGVYVSGNPSLSEESYPDFAKRNFSAPASLTNARAMVVYSWPKTDLTVSYVYNGNHLPFTTFAILGAEVNALESGFHADSRANLSSLCFAARTLIGAGVRLWVGTQLTVGNENLELTDAYGTRPSRTLPVKWQETASPDRNHGKGPGYTIAGGAEFSIGGGSK